MFIAKSWQIVKISVDCFEHICSRWEVADSMMAAGEESRAHIGQPGDDGRCSGSTRRPDPPWLVVPEKKRKIQIVIQWK